MRIGLDYRMVASAPMSGISRQIMAMQAVLQQMPQINLQRFAVAEHGALLREKVSCPPWSCPSQAMHQPHQRLRFELCYLPYELRRQAIDLYIANFNMGLPLPPRPRGARYVLLLHDVFQITLKNYHANRLKAWIYRLSDYLSIAYALRAADYIWTPSRFTADEVVRLFPHTAEKVRVLPNLVDGFAQQGEPEPMALPARYWLAVGTRELRKNMPWFVGVWAQARQQDPAVPELVLVGDVQHLPASLRDLPGLRAVSGLTDGQLAQVYRGAERLWQPSYAEGFGLPVVEALSVGVPVAVATGSSLEEVAPAWSPRFSPHDSGALLSLMRQLACAGDEDKTALIQWAQRFGHKAYAQRLNELIMEASA